MDKYRRDDDMNDDLGAYTHEEDYSNLSIVKSDRSNLRVFGRRKVEGEFLDRLNKAKARLSAKERELMELIMNEGITISEASKRLGITQQVASKYWQRIKAKLA